MAIWGIRASLGSPKDPQKIKVGAPWTEVIDDSGKAPELTYPGP